jgi:hypothetical protein
MSAYRLKLLTSETQTCGLERIPRRRTVINTGKEKEPEIRKLTILTGRYGDGIDAFWWISGSR